MIQMADALVIIDLQNGVCCFEEKINRYYELVDIVNDRIKQYKNKNKEIIFIQHCDKELIVGSNDWAIIPELIIPENAHFIKKTHADSFYKTDFQNLLKELYVKQLEICGAQTEYCIDATIKVAHNLNFKIIMKHGATTTYDNFFMTAEKTVDFYENIWCNRFLEFID